MKKHISLPSIALSLVCAFTCIALAASVFVLYAQTRATVHASAGPPPSRYNWHIRNTGMQDTPQSGCS